MSEIILNAPGGGWTQACHVDVLLNGVVHLVRSDARCVRNLAQIHRRRWGRQLTRRSVSPRQFLGIDPRLVGIWGDDGLAGRSDVRRECIPMCGECDDGSREIWREESSEGEILRERTLIMSAPAPNQQKN